MNKSGFTLIELVVSLSILLIAISTAAACQITVSRHLLRAEKETAAVMHLQNEMENLLLTPFGQLKNDPRCQPLAGDLLKIRLEFEGLELICLKSSY